VPALRTPFVGMTKSFWNDPERYLENADTRANSLELAEAVTA
jgi:acyl-coenzyme A synthetase/AMP-(fatty) acid ligase